MSDGAVLGSPSDRWELVPPLVYFFAEKQYVLAELYVKYCSKTGALERFFQNFPKFMERNWSVFDKWAVSCFASRFCQKPYEMDTNELVNGMLESSRDPTIQLLKNVLFGQKEMDANEKKNFPFYLLLLENMDCALFRVLKKRFAPIVNAIGASQIISTVGVQGLALLDNLKENDFRVELPTIGLAEITDSTYDAGVLRTVQSVVTKYYRYPLDSPVTESPVLMSLANTAMLGGAHFFDVIAGEIRRLIEEGKLDLIPQAARASAVVVPFVIAAAKPIIYENLPKYYRLISAEFPETIVTPLQRRMCNDVALLKMVSFLTGKEISTADLEKHSLPFLLGCVMHLKEVEKYADVKCFAYSDEAISTDFDFMFCYKAIKGLLGLLGSQDQQNQRAQDLWGQTRGYVESVKNPETKKQLANDLFSLMFLCKNDRLMCSPWLAKQIVEVVYNIDRSIYHEFAKKSLETIKSDQLAHHFGVNRINLVNAMNDGNWRDAELISTTNPAYRREYMIGVGIADLLRSGKVVDCGEYSTEFRIEAGLSTVYARDLLNGIKVEDPYLQELVNGRVNVDDNVLAALRTHPHCQESVVEFDKFCEPFIAEGKQLAAAEHHKQLSEWLENLRLFFKCSLLCNRIQQSTFSEILKFQAQKVLSGAVNSNNINLAVSIARKFGMDLFRFVLNHLEWFDITSEFTQRFHDRYPLECMTLNLTVIPPSDWNGLRIPQKYQKFVAPKQQEPSEDVLFLTAVTALENPATPLEFYDDLIWRIDHAKFCDELVKRIDRISEETATALLDIVGYTMSEATEQQISTCFMMKRRIFQVAHSRVEGDIIQKLVEEGEIELLSSYLFQYGDGEKLGDYLLSVSKRLTGDGEKLRLLLSRFPDYLEFLAKNLEEIIPDILPICPERRKVQFRAFCFLPSVIRSECSLSDKQSIVEAFCRHPELITHLSHADLCLFPNRNDLLQMLRTSEVLPLSGFISSASVLLRLEPKNDTLLKFVREHLDSVFESITVRSNEIEDQAFDDVASIKLFCQACDLGEAILNKACACYNFVFRRPFLHTRMSYSLSKSGIEGVMKICFMYDLDQSAVELAACFDYDLTRYVLHRAYIPMILNQFTTVNDILASFEKQTGCAMFDITKFDRYDPVFSRNSNEPKMSENDMLSMNSPFLVPFMCYPVFRPEVITAILEYDVASLRREGSPGNVPIYKDIRLLCQKKRKPKMAKNQSAIFFFRRFSSLESQMSLLVAFNDFGNLFPTLIAIPTYEGKRFALIHRMMHMAICFDVERTAEKAFYQFDPQFAMTGTLWNDLVKFCQERKMLNLLVDLYAFLGRLEDAGLASVRIFKNASNFGRKLSAIGVASICLTDSVKYRLAPDFDHVPVFKPSDNSLEYITELAKIVDIQKDVCNFLYRQGVSTKESIDIIHVQSAPVRVAGIIFQFTDPDNELLKKIMSEFNITFKTLFRIVADQMKDQSITDLLNFVSQKQGDPRFLNDLLPELLQAVSMTPNPFNIQLILNKAGFPSVVDEIKHSLDYNFVENSFCLITDHLDTPGVRELIPLLAYKASQAGHMNIVDKCFYLC